MSKRLLYSLIVLALLFIGYWSWEYYRPLPSTQKQKADLSMSAVDLFARFEKDEQEANQQFLDKLIEVSGEVISVTNESGQFSILLKAGEISAVQCQMQNPAGNEYAVLQAGNQIRVKGICTGMLIDVVLVRCVLVQNQ